MKTLALVINRNQNEVSKSEINKIKRAVRKAHEKYSDEKLRITTYANDEAFDPMETQYKESDCVVFNTDDVNYCITATLVFGAVGDLYSIEITNE